MTSQNAAIGYYVHHHGDGHAARFRAIAGASAHRIVPISERRDLGDGLVLPSDVPSVVADDPTAGGALHWAPLDRSSGAPRLRTLIAWLDRERPAGVVVDVSVEVALACRLAGFATVFVRQHGARSDRPHRMAYSAATGLLAPYPRELETECAPQALRKTCHVGFIHPVDVDPTAHPASSANRTTNRPTHDDAVVLWGSGGGHLSGALIDALAESVDGSVYCAGREIWAPRDGPSNSKVIDLGWVDDVSMLLAERPLVVSSAGTSCVAAAARFHCPLVVVASARPFDEQLDHATALARARVAALAPRTAGQTAWREAVSAARVSATTWSRLQPEHDGAPAAAAAIAGWLLR